MHSILVLSAHDGWLRRNARASEVLTYHCRDHRVQGERGARRRVSSLRKTTSTLCLNLQDRPNPEPADILLARDIPFAFVTGFDYLVETRHEAIQLLQNLSRKANLAVSWQRWCHEGLARRLAVAPTGLKDEDACEHWRSSSSS